LTETKQDILLRLPASPSNTCSAMLAEKFAMDVCARKFRCVFFSFPCTCSHAETSDYDSWMTTRSAQHGGGSDALRDDGMTSVAPLPTARSVDEYDALTAADRNQRAVAFQTSTPALKSSAKPPTSASPTQIIFHNVGFAPALVRRPTSTSDHQAAKRTSDTGGGKIDAIALRHVTLLRVRDSRMASKERSNEVENRIRVLIQESPPPAVVPRAPWRD
jgi:hypothetical protein